MLYYCSMKQTENKDFNLNVKINTKWRDLIYQVIGQEMSKAGKKISPADAVEIIFGKFKIK